MVNIRTMPFGYTMTDGVIQPSGDEAEIVKSIFDDFSQRIPITAITHRLNLCGVRYRDDHTPWNKNMVCRILDDSRYKGEREYPPIISPDLYFAVFSIRKSQSIGKINPEVRSIRKKIVCASCKSSMLRLSDKKKFWITWKCSRCGIKTVSIFDDNLVEQVLCVIRSIVADPLLAAYDFPRNDPVSLSVVKKSKEFERYINTPAWDENYALNLAIEIAQESYQACTSGDIEADNSWVQYLIAEAQNGNLSEEEFIKQTVEEIQLSANGQISVRLVNNKIL